MHELAICQALVSQLENIAGQHGGRIRQVRVGIGPLAGIEPRLLESAYPLACAGTYAEGSQLEIQENDARVHCRKCGTDSTVIANRLACGACGNWQTELLAGDELLLLRVELETAEDIAEASHV